MNILLITELYCGIEEMPRTTAIHDLVKYWSKDHNIRCIREVPLGWKKYIWYKVRSLFGVPNPYKNIPESFVLDDVKVFTLKYLSYPHKWFWGKFMHNRCAQSVNRVLRQESFMPDVIIAHMPTFNVMYYVDKISDAKAKRVAVLHKSDIDKMSKSGATGRERVALLDTNFDVIASRSRVISEQASRFSLKHLTSKVIYSGVEEIEDYRRDIQNWQGLKDRAVNLLYVGSLIEQKGVQKIIRCMAELSERYSFHLSVVGSGNYEKTLRDLVHDLKMEDRVSFEGSKPKKEVYVYMRNADIFFMPSYHETLGLVYLEAMAHGCITIGSKGEGIDGIIIDGENGFLVNPYDLNEMKSTLEKIACMDERGLDRISKAAIKTMQHYTQKNMSEEYLAFLKGQE